MDRKVALRTVFMGLGIALFAWWAGDGRLAEIARDFYFAYALRDAIDRFTEYGLGFGLGGAFALWGAYRYLSAQPEAVEKSPPASHRGV